MQLEEIMQREPMYPLCSFSPQAGYRHWYSQDAERFHHYKDPSRCPFIATLTSLAHPLALIFYETLAISLLLVTK